MPKSCVAVFCIVALGSVATSAQQQKADKLTRELTSANPVVRVKAVKRVGKLGRKAKRYFAALVQCLGDPDDAVAVSASIACTQLGKPLEPLLRGELRSSSKRQRVMAAATLARSGRRLDATESVAVAEAILPMFSADKAVPRREAARASGGLAAFSDVLLRGLVHLLEDRDESVRSVARGSVWRISQDSLPRIVKLFEQDKVSASWKLIHALAPTAATRRFLNELTQREDAPAAAAALHRLGEFGREARALAPRFASLTSAKSPAVRAQALRALGRVAADYEALLGPVGAALADPSPEPQQAAAEILRNRVPMLPSFVPHLMKQLESPKLAEGACRALRRCGSWAAELVRKGSQSKDPSIVVFALDALARCAKLADAEIAVVVSLLDHAEASIRRRAIATIQYVGAPANAAVPKLLSMLGGPECVAAAAALAAIGDKRAIPPLLRLLKSKEASTRRAAIQALATFGPKRVKGLVKKLTRLLGEREVGWAAAEALASMRWRAKASLKRLLAVTRAGKTDGRHWHAWAVGQIAGADDSDPGRSVRMEEVRRLLTPMLRVACKDRDAAVREWAARSAAVMCPRAKRRSKTVKSLQTLLEDASVNVREAVLEVLPEVAGAEVAIDRVMLAPLRGKPRRPKIAALKGLARLTTPLEPTLLAAVRSVFSSSDPESSRFAAELLASRDEDAQAFFVAALAQPAAHIRRSAVRGLYRLRTAPLESAPRLLELALEPDSRMRYEIAYLFRWGMDALGELEQAARSKHLEHRRLAASALSPNKAEQTALEILAKDADELVRFRAESKLRSLLKK